MSNGNLPIADNLFGKSGVNSYYKIDRRDDMDLTKLIKRFSELVLIVISAFTRLVREAEMRC